MFLVDDFQYLFMAYGSMTGFPEIELLVLEACLFPGKKHAVLVTVMWHGIIIRDDFS